MDVVDFVVVAAFDMFLLINKCTFDPVVGF